MNHKIILAPLLSTLTIATSVFAFDGSNSPYFQIADKLLGGSLGQIEGLVREIYDYLDDVIDSNGLSVLDALWAELQGQCQDEGFAEVCGLITREGTSLVEVLSATTSALGIPDPTQYHDHIAREINQSTQLTPWGYYTNSSPAQTQIRNAADRGLTTVWAGSLLSGEGQAQAQESWQLNAELAQAGIETATQAFKATNTQDVLKMIALMHSQQMILTQKTSTTKEMSRLDHQIANLNLANISQSVDLQLNQKAVEDQIRSDALIDSLRRIRLF